MAGNVGTGFVTLERRVGRVVEMRSRGKLTLAQARNLEEPLRAAFDSVSGPVLGVVDSRHTDAIPDQIAQQLVVLLRLANPRIERLGFLMGGRPLFTVQLEAMILSTRHPGERTFHDLPALLAFVGKTATDAERLRMAEFFAESPDEQPESTLRGQAKPSK